MPQYGTWFSYSGSAKLILAIVLLAAAGALAIAGTRLPLPARLPRPGKNATTLMVVAWGLSLTAFLACVGIYGKHAHQEHLAGRPADNIFPVTLLAAGVTFHHRRHRQARRQDCGARRRHHRDGQFSGRVRALTVVGPPGTAARLHAAMECLFPARRRPGGGSPSG